MSRRRGGFDVASDGASRRSASAAASSVEGESTFRRLAAQLGLSRQLQQLATAAADDDDGADGLVQNTDAGTDADVSRRRRREAEPRRRQRDDVEEEEEEEEEEDGDDEQDDDDRVGEGLESPLTPLRSDYSASESLSSELSLPRSFGNYDVMRTRKPPFDDELQRRTQRNTERNAGLASGGAAGAGGGRHDMLRKFYEAQVEKIRAQLAVVTQAQHHIETTLQGERQQWAQKLLDMEQTLEEERAASAKECDALQGQLGQLRERLRMEKTHLRDLQISDALAEQLSRQDEEDLSVKEFVQLHVHRRVRHLESELATARREIESLQQLCATYKSHASSANDEVGQLVRAADAKELKLQHELELSEASRAELEGQMRTLCAQLDVLKEHQAKMELDSSRRLASVDVYTENEKLQSELQLAGERLRVTANKNDELRKHVDDLQQQVTLLTADKAFLQDAKRQLEDHELRLMAKNKELQTRNDLAMTAQLAGANELTQQQEVTRLEFEKKLAREVDKFMELSKREIETIRSNSQMVYERENRLLKEARDDALNQIDALQTRLQSVQCSLEEKVLESTRMESAHTAALSTLRSELKMKHFEMTQLGITLEERSTDLRSAKLEIEMLQQKLEVHKEEFARLESTSTMRITQLESALETERRRLEEYERLEVDLDDAVLRTGAIGVNELRAEGQGGCAPQKLDDVMSTFGAIPTSTKRRFHQSVRLAQRVVQYQKESIDLQRKLDICDADKQQLEKDLADLRKQLSNLHQPQSYLIDKLGQKDIELQKLQRTNEQLQTQLAELRAEYQQTNSAKMALQAQLQQVLARREELHGLKRTVEALRKKLVVVDELPPGDPMKSQPSPVMLKNPPSPHVMSQMLRPPAAPSPSPQANRSDDCTGANAAPASAADASPPQWYVKLRST